MELCQYVQFMNETYFMEYHVLWISVTEEEIRRAQLHYFSAGKELFDAKKELTLLRIEKLKRELAEQDVCS